jgi:hypothetical protein
VNNIEFFEEQVKYYFFDIFKLHQYHLDIGGGAVDCLACTEYGELEEGTKAITISYSSEWLIGETDVERIRLVAFHEVLEALLSGLVQVAESRYITESMVPNAIHAIIRTMENTVLKYLPKKEIK